MSQTLTVNGIEYVPAGVAGKHFGYTRDYMLMLARAGKIDGRKIGHRWYINIASTEKYFHEAKSVREERRQKISNERKVELESYEQTRERAYRQKSATVLEAAAILGIGLIIGATGYIGVNSHDNKALAIESNQSFFKQFAISFFDFISPNDVVVLPITVIEPNAQDHTVAPAPSADVLTDSTSLPVATTTHTSLVVAPDQILTTTTVESIRDSFSDDVSVSIDPQNPDTGIIIPHFKDADGEAYRYLMVPVSEGK